MYVQFGSELINRAGCDRERGGYKENPKANQETSSFPVYVAIIRPEQSFRREIQWQPVTLCNRRVSPEITKTLMPPPPPHK